MNVSAPFIARPVATWLLALGLVLVGLMGYRMLPVSALPQVDFPTIQVTTQLPGASAETIASLVTTPLERQLGLIPGLSSMSSNSSEGISAITLQFGLSKNLDVASEEVQAAINASKSTLPTNLPYPPTYSKVNPADPAILTLALTSDTLPVTRINDVVDTQLVPKLAQISGVGRVQVEGGQRPAVRLQLDPARLASYGLSLEAVRTALSNANVDLAKGSFDGPQQALSVAANDQLSDVSQYESLVVSWKNGAPVRIRDVGKVVEEVENAKVAGWYQGKPAVILDIQRQPGQNIVATVERIKAQLPTMSQSLPAGLSMTILADRTETIRASVGDVQFTMILTVGLVILVIFLFLRSGRATIIPSVALPMSLIATFAVMSALGYALDNLSLMALTISAGFVVDDAIVMIENIVRYIEAGEKPLQAAFKGAKEIGFTVVSLTVSLVAVFIPLLFMSGIVGRLFREFAMTLTVSVVASAVISLTLTPMMCGRILRPSGRAPGPDGQHDNSGPFFHWLRRQYESSLRVVMRHQRLTLLVAVGTLVGTVLLYMGIPKGFLPLQDTSMISVTTDARQDISFRAMSGLQSQVAEMIQNDPDVTGVASFLGTGTVNTTPNTGHLTVVLKARDQRSASVNQVIRRLAPQLASIVGVNVHMQATQDIQIGARSSRTQYQYILTDVDGDELHQWVPKVLAAMQGLPALTDVATDQQDQGMQTMVRVDRDKAARLGVPLQSIDDTLYDAFGQRQVSTIYSQVNQYHVVLEVEPRFRDAPERLASLYVPTSAGTPVPLSAVATIERGTAPLLISHQAQFPAVTISFNLASGASLGEAIQAVNTVEAAMGLPDTISRDFTGDAAEFRSSLADEPWLILAAAVVIYIVLGVLYESTIHPVTIISTLPSAGVGALLALIICGQDLSLVALVGIVLLMGIVKKNAIMMIDFALVAEREQGRTPEQAIFHACVLRFRPIMMTTMAALLGAVPLAFDQGTGSELRRPMGIAIVGGLLLSQLLTLYTTPVIYLALERLRVRLGGRPPEPHPAAPSSMEAAE